MDQVEFHKNVWWIWSKNLFGTAMLNLQELERNAMQNTIFSTINKNCFH